jgi:hypothetical protein
MAEKKDDSEERSLTEEWDRAGLPKDDERLSRENIERTGEPIRDRLGNQEGGS